MPNAKHLPAETCGCASAVVTGVFVVIFNVLDNLLAAVVAHYNSLHFRIHSTHTNTFAYTHSVYWFSSFVFNISTIRLEKPKGEKELLCHLQMRTKWLKYFQFIWFSLSWPDPSWFVHLITFSSILINQLHEESDWLNWIGFYFIVLYCADLQKRLPHGCSNEIKWHVHLSRSCVRVWVCIPIACAFLLDRICIFVRSMAKFAAVCSILEKKSSNNCV